eukprot:6205863-Amphidinium_carterae.1
MEKQLLPLTQKHCDTMGLASPAWQTVSPPTPTTYPILAFSSRRCGRKVPCPSLHYNDYKIMKMCAKRLGKFLSRAALRSSTVNTEHDQRQIADMPICASTTVCLCVSV